MIINYAVNYAFTFDLNQLFKKKQGPYFFEISVIDISNCALGFVMQIS